MSLELLFTKSKTEGETKIAVLKVAPEIRAAILKTGGYIYLGLSRCKAHDRFWVTQCFHCQGFGHTASKCRQKNERPFCAYCAGRHETSACGSKSTPKCINCSKSGDSTNSCEHYAFSPDCSFMVSQRNRLIENTNFVSSKNA